MGSDMILQPSLCGFKIKMAQVGSAFLQINIDDIAKSKNLEVSTLMYFPTLYDHSPLVQLDMNIEKWSAEASSPPLKVSL